MSLRKRIMGDSLNLQHLMGGPVKKRHVIKMVD